jgi:prepilin-type N-terminal cleavage/methylation domain-containing protein
MNMKWKQSGFTLVEIAIVLLIVTILLGYTVALFPSQQKLKQYRAVDRQMDEVMEAIIGFAQVNGRLPCPAIPNSGGVEDFDKSKTRLLPFHIHSLSITRSLSLSLW